MRACELCSSRAAVYCSADKAFVCWDCDAKVHGANFIVARHTRLILCDSCWGPGVVWSGRSVESRRYICHGCSFTTDSGQVVSSSLGSAGSTTDPLEDDVDSDDEISSTKRFQLGVHTPRPRSPDTVLRPNRELGKRLTNIKASQVQVNVTAEPRLQSILRRWSRSLGLANADDRIVPRTLHLLRRVSWLLKSKRLKERLDARATLAACLWAAIKLEAGPGEAAEAVLLPPRLERCTGVSVLVLVAVEAKLRAALSSSSSSLSSKSASRSGA